MRQSARRSGVLHQSILDALEPRLLMVATPHSPDGLPWAISATAISWVEAENFDNGGEGVAYHDTTTANQGGQYRLSEGVDIEGPNTYTGGTYNVGYIVAGEWMNYTINVAVAGDYQLSIRAANANAATANAHVTIGAVNSGTIAIPTTGGWGNYQNYNVTMTLAAGVQSMRITDDLGGYNLDYLSLQPVGTLGGEQAYGTRGLPPLIASGGQAQIEAENYDTGGEGVAYHRSAAKSSTATLNGAPFRAADAVSTSNGGSGIYTSYWKPGDWTQYTVNTTTAGTYELLLNYARGDTGNSNFTINVNGTTQVSALALPSTASWTTYTTVGTTVNLTAGANIIRFTTGVGQINFDYFQLLTSTTFGNNGASWYLPGTTTPTRIEAENFDVNAGAYSDTTPGNSGNSNYRPGTDVDLSTTTDTSGSVDVVNFAAGEYLNYTIRPNATSAYNVSLRVKAPAGGTLQLQFDSGGGFTGNSNLLTYNITVPTVAGYQTVTIPTVFMAGLQTMRLTAVSGGVDVNWIEIAGAPNSAVAKPDATQSGSYAATPPQAALNTVSDLFNRVYQKQYDWVNRPAGAAIPTNDWWTQILENTFAASLWAYPERIGDSTAGAAFTTFSGLNITAGNITTTGGQTLTVGDNAVSVFTKDSLLDYGDWTVHYRMLEAGANYMDVTIGRGLPYAWFEFSGITPSLNVGTGATDFDSNGAALGNTFTTDRFRVNIGGNQFGIFAPAGTQFVLANGKYTVTFSGADKYVVVAALPDATNTTLDTFYQHAYAIPRQSADGTTPSSAFTYNYDPVAGVVSTTWTLNTVALKTGASLQTIQGWLPQDYEDIVSGPTLIAGALYPTIQGAIKISIGNVFTIGQKSTGINFLLAAPQSIGGTSDYSSTQMTTFIHKYITDNTNAAASAAAGKTILNYKTDTYWGGKNPQEFAEFTLMAKQIGDTADYNVLLDNLRTCLTDWFTYTPGEANRYFAFYPGTEALIGFDPSYGSENFTDNMFHYGYFVAAAGVLAMLDSTWAAQYGAMATMVAKQYANWVRPTNTSDVTSLPYFRTFEFWIGHSYAGGTGDARGNNEESSSESIQSWLGLALLGQALNDSAMTAAGIMGYTRESKAVQYQWFDVKNEIFAPNYARSNVAINYDDAKGYYTFFGANPEYILGIESLPLWPSLDFLGQYPAVALNATNLMLQQRTVFYADPTKNTFASFEDGTNVNDWLNITLGFQSMYDPQASANEFARMISQATPTGKAGTTGLYYYQDQAYRTYGLRDWNYHLSLPVGGVYTHAVDGSTMSNTRTYMVYNPNAIATTVNVYNAAGAVVDSFTAAPRTNTFVTRNLAVANAPPTVATPAAASDPGSGITSNLSVLGADDGGEPNLTYTWSVVSKPSGAADPTFSLNGTNAAKNSVATFSQNGNYTLRATITDAGALSVTSDAVVNVTFGFTGITLGTGGAYVINTAPAGAFIIHVTAGIVNFASDQGTGPRTVSLDVAGGATANLNSSQTFNAMTLGTNSIATLSAGGAKVLVLNALSLTGSTDNWSSKLDLNDNDLVLIYGSGTNPFATMTNQIKFGLTNSQTKGIVSTSILSATATALALNDNANATMQRTTFSGINLDISHQQILIKYTYKGDANLDGAVTSADYTYIDGHFGQSGPGIQWSTGDFNMDGSVSSADYTYIDGSFGLGVGAPLSATETPVTTPTTVPAAASPALSAGTAASAPAVTIITDSPPLPGRKWSRLKFRIPPRKPGS